MDDGAVAELVDAHDSNSCGSNIMRVRFSPAPPFVWDRLVKNTDKI